MADGPGWAANVPSGFGRPLDFISTTFGENQ